MVDYEVDKDQVIEGAVAGVASFVVGLLGAIVLASPGDSDDIFDVTVSAMGMSESSTVTYGELGGEGASKPETWKVAGWVYHKAHFASIDVGFSGLGDLGGDVSVSASFVMDVPILVRLLPILLLGIAGFVLAERASVEDIQESAITGAHVVVGYLPLALLSTFLLTWEDTSTSGGMEATVTAEPSLVTALVFTGILFPVILGAVGGAVNHEFGDDILEAIGQG